MSFFITLNHFKIAYDIEWLTRPTFIRKNCLFSLYKVSLVPGPDTMINIPMIVTDIRWTISTAPITCINFEISSILVFWNANEPNNHVYLSNNTGCDNKWKSYIMCEIRYSPQCQWCDFILTIHIYTDQSSSSDKL